MAGDDREIARYREAFEALSLACRPGGAARTLACLKRILRRGGVLASEHVAPGTPGLSPSEAEAFDRAFEGVRVLLSGVPTRWRTPWPLLEGVPS